MITALTRREASLLALTAFAPIIGAAKAEGTKKGGRSISKDELLRYVDPELRPFLRTLPPETEITGDEVKHWRKSVETSASQPDGVVGRFIPGFQGAPDVRIFVVGASGAARRRPALLYMHGGGYISGNTATSWPGFGGLKQIAQDHDCVVVSVDYRLAPETRFPGALQDNYAALKWLYSNAESLGVDRTRIAIMGESAGGGHAATLAIAARDRGEVPILFQLLIYPMLDDRTGTTRAVPPQIGSFIWTRQANRFGWSSLLGVPAGSRSVPRGSVPSRTTNFHRLPPTYIGVGALDLFVDEDIEFAKHLVDAGVPTELYVSPGAYHGFFFLAPDAAISKRFAASYNTALAQAFARGARPYRA